MADCKELAKTLIAKQLISNDGFVKVVDEISKKIDGLNLLQKTPKVQKRLDYLDEALEVAYMSTVLDLPRSEVMRNNVLRRVDKTLSGSELLEQKKQLFYVIDSVKNGDAAIEEGVLDGLLDTFNITRDDFITFINKVSEVENKKVTLEYIKQKDYSLEKVFGMDKAEIKKAIKAGKISKMLEDEAIKFDAYLSSINKEFDKLLTPTEDLKGDELKKVNKANQEIIKEKQLLMNNYLVAKSLDGNLEPEDLTNLLNNVLGRARYGGNSVDISDLSYIEDKASGLTRITIPGPEGSLPGEATIKFDKNGDPIIDVVGAPRTQVEVVDEEGLLDDLIDRKPTGEPIKGTNTLGKVVERIRDQGYKTFKTTPTSKDGQGALDSLVKKGVISYDGKSKSYSIIEQTRTLGEVNVSTINSMTTIEQMKDLLYMYLPNFKDKALFKAYQKRLDELNFGEDVKIKEMLDRVENISKNPTKVVESLLDLVKKEKKRTRKSKKLDNTKVIDTVIQKIAGQALGEGDIYFYKPELPFDDMSKAAEATYKKFSVKVGTIGKDKVLTNVGELSTDMNVIVDNITTAKTINGFSPIFPNVFGNNKTLGFFEEDGVLYVGAGNDKDFQELLNVLDDMNLDVGDKKGVDEIVAGYKLRWGKDFKGARSLLETISKTDNILVQTKYLESLGGINPKGAPNEYKVLPQFESWVGNKTDIINSLPDDINFYYEEAVKYAKRYGMTLPEKITDGDLKTAKALYADFMIVHPDAMASQSDIMAEYLNLFGSTGKVIDNTNRVAVYMNMVTDIVQDGFDLPAAQFNNTFDKIGRGENISGEMFVSQFITKNQRRLGELEGFTEIDKVKNYLTEKFNLATSKNTNPVNPKEITDTGFGLYMRRTDNTYADLLPDDLDFRLLKGTTESIEGDFKVIKDILNRYVKEVEDIIGRATSENRPVLEQEMYLLSRRTQRTIAKYEEEYLLPSYESIMLNNQILGHRYDAMKVTSLDDLDALKERINGVNAEIDNVVKLSQGKNLNEVNLKEAQETLEKDGFAFVNLGGKKNTSIQIDDLIRKELITTGSDVRSIDNLDLSQFTNKEKFELLANIKAVKLAPKTGNVYVQMYESIFPALRGFFNDYEMVDTILDLGEGGNKVQLPKLLARTNAVTILGDGTLVPDMDDLAIKKGVLEEISPFIRAGELTTEKIAERVAANMDKYLSVDNFARITKSYPKQQIIDIYVEQFKPYTLLVGIPDNLINDFTAGVMARMNTLGDVPLSSINVVVDGKTVPLNQAMKTPEKTFPNVIYGEQRFSRPTLDRNGEEFIAKFETDMKLARDMIDTTVDDMDLIRKNWFGEIAMIMDKSPRLKQMKEVILGNDSRAQAAGTIIEKIGSKEELIAIQEHVKRFMDMTDEQFDAILKSDTRAEQHTGQALRVAEYFRSMNRSMSKIPVDQGMRDIFNNFQSRFLSLKNNDYGLKSKGLGVSIKNNELFKIVEYKTTGSFQQQRRGMGLVNKLDDQVELDFFNQAFQSNITMNEFQRIMVTLSDLNLNGILQRVERGYSTVMKKWLGGRLTRFLTSRPRTIMTLPQQIMGYKTLERGLEKIVGDHDWDKVELLRREIGSLSSEIPEVDLNSALGAVSGIISRGINKGGLVGIQDQLAALRSSNLGYVLDAVKDNANNLVDVGFGRAIKNRAFMDGIMHNGYRTFYSLDEFETFFRNAPLAEREALIQAIDMTASRQFENIMGFSQNALFRNTNSGVLASIWKLFEVTTGFRSGWGLNMAKRAMNKLSRTGEVGLYLARNGFSQEAIDNGVRYFMKDRDIGIFFSTMMYDMYYATKLKRYIETREENEENESFFDFIGNELTDLKGWRETLGVMSQGVQALYSGGPLRPFIFAAEAATGQRDGSMTAAFLEGVRGAAFRQFKLLNNVTLGAANLGGELYENGFEYDGITDNTVADAIGDLMWQTSAGTLRYMMMDRDYQKNLYYIPQDNNPLDFLGVSLNPYIEAETRMASIAATATLENNPARAMRDLLYGTYAGKFYNNALWIGRGLMSGNFSSRYNMSDKYDFAEVLEQNPVYSSFIERGTLDLTGVPEQYRGDLYKAVTKKLTGSGYIPGGIKQEDAMNTYLQNYQNEEWREKQESIGGVSRASMEIMDFLGPDDVQYILNTIKSVKGKEWNANKKEEFVYDYVKEKINSVDLEDKPYGYFFLDTAHFLTRDVPTKNLSKMEQEILQQNRVNQMLDVFMDRDAFELEQGIYKDVRDDMVLESMYRADTEAFKPFFSVYYNEYGDARVSFDSGYKNFFDGMSQTLMKAEEDDLNGFEVAFSNLVKGYKDKPYAAVAVYNELSKFLEGRGDIENKDDMLNWFLIKNSELLEDPELLKEQIGVDMYNELLFNLKRREEEIQTAMIDSGGTGGGKKPKASNFRFAGLKAFEKLSKAWGTKPMPPTGTSSTGKTPGITYGNSRGKEGISGNKFNPKRYSVDSVSIRGESTAKKKDIDRSTKALKRKILTDKNLGIQKKKV